MTHLSLFSGIGGFDEAARWAGFRTVQFVEQDPFCQKVLAKNFPGVPIHDDICTFDGERYRGTTTLISGGFPCQDISLAGKREGLAGDRSGLWFRMLEVIASVRPSWVVAENVGALISMGIDTCLSGLEAEGYAARAIIVPACGVGANHRRERVFIVAHAQGEQNRRVLIRGVQPNTVAGSQDVAHACRQPEPQEGAPTCTVGGGWNPRNDVSWSSGRRGTGSSWWLSEPAVGRVVDGVSKRLDKHHAERLRALGNAVVPQQVYPILEAIAKVERAEVAG